MVTFEHIGKTHDGSTGINFHDIGGWFNHMSIDYCQYWLYAERWISCIRSFWVHSMTNAFHVKIFGTRCDHSENDPKAGGVTRDLIDGTISASSRARCNAAFKSCSRLCISPATPLPDRGLRERAPTVESDADETSWMPKSSCFKCVSMLLGSLQNWQHSPWNLSTSFVEKHFWETPKGRMMK